MPNTNNYIDSLNHKITEVIPLLNQIKENLGKYPQPSYGLFHRHTSQEQVVNLCKEIETLSSKLSDASSKDTQKSLKEISNSLKGEFSSVVTMLCHQFLDSDVNKQNSRARLIFGFSFSLECFDESPFTKLLKIRRQDLNQSPESQEFASHLSRRFGQKIATEIAERFSFHDQVGQMLPSKPSPLQQFCNWLVRLVNRHHQPTAGL